MRFRIFGLFSWLLLIPTNAHPANNVENRESAAERMAKEFSGLGVHKIYVPDSCDGLSSPNARGAFFAATFSALLAAKAEGFAVVSRIGAHRFLQQNSLTDCALVRPEILSMFSSEFGVDSILSADLSFDKESDSVNFILRNLSGKELSRSQYSEPHDVGTEACFPATASPSGWPFYFAALDGVTKPKAVYMPMAPYPENGRTGRISGVVVMSAIVTTAGRIDQIRVVQKLNPDTDRAVMETMKSWRFVTARDPDGSPVPVRITLELSLSPKE